MQHPYVLAGHNVNQFTGLDVPNFDETRLERQNVWIIQRESLRRAFPCDLPIRSRTPAVAVNEKAEVGIVEEELPIQTFYVDGSDILLTCDEVERRIGLVEQGLSLGGFQRDDFEAFGTSDTKSRAEVVHRGGFGWDVELLEQLLA